MRSVLMALWLSSSAWLLPAQADACSCIEAGSARDALRGAAAVFEGRVLEVVKDAEGEGLPMVTVRLAVVRSWKGATRESATLRTAESSAACGYHFEPNESYLVYAEGSEETLRVGLCSRTRRMSEADTDVTELGMGVVPVSPKAAQEEHSPAARGTIAKGEGGCASCHALGATSTSTPRNLGLITAGLVLLCLGRRRGARER